MLILGSLSGIQDFLFDIRETGGGQARSLRHRSFRIQLLSECVALRLLQAVDLTRDRLLFCAAAKFAIETPELSGTALQDVARTIDELIRTVMDETHGRLRLAVVIQPGAGNFGETFRRAERSLALAKLRPFAPVAAQSGWGATALVVRGEPWDAEREADADANLGRQLVNKTWLTIEFPPSGLNESDVVSAGLLVRLHENEPSPSPTLLSCSNLSDPERPPAKIDRRLFHVRRLARYIPRNEQGEAIEFVDLAMRSKGAPMLGVLKADADSLGAAFAALSSSTESVDAIRTLSTALDRFFADKLEREKERLDSPWRTIYTVFSGGDDILAVGPWDVVFDFAGHMRRLFSVEFRQGQVGGLLPAPLTISAGIAVMKPRHPVRLGALEAEGLLEDAKSRCALGASVPKDQCAALGQIWKWSEHEAVINAGRRLASWVDRRVVRRSWLHTLLTLTKLRRGQVGPELMDTPPIVATSRLVYHVDRNWPKKYSEDPDAKHARAWIDTIVEHFDDDLNDPATPVDVRYLPAILRYAILATKQEREG